MKWFRLYSEARNDAKLRHLEDFEHRIWFNLLCFSSEQEERGTIPVKNQYLLAVEVAGGDDEALKKTIEKLKMLDIVELIEDKIIFTHFAERQYDNPSDRPENVKDRVAKHRAKKKNEQKTKSNDLVTRCNETDTDTDTDTNTELDKEINNVVVVEDPSVEDSPGIPITNDPKFAKAYTAFEKQFYYAVNSVQTDELARFIGLGMEPEVIEEAISITRKNAKDLDYFWGILTNLETQGILTMAAFEEGRQKKKRNQQRGHPTKRDILPDYVQRQSKKRSSTSSTVDLDQQKEADRLMVQLEEMSKEQFYQKWGEGA